MAGIVTIARSRALAPPRAAGQLLRAIVGVALRRQLRHRDPLTRIALLVEAFSAIDAHARALAHRLRTGLTRAWGAAPAPEPAQALAMFAASATIVTDSS